MRVTGDFQPQHDLWAVPNSNHRELKMSTLGAFAVGAVVFVALLTVSISAIHVDPILPGELAGPVERLRAY